MCGRAGAPRVGSSTDDLKDYGPVEASAGSGTLMFSHTDLLGITEAVMTKNMRALQPS